jgi:hypothetical protein
MIELLMLALVGSVIAGLWDLKTTEVPDELPYLMTGFGLFYWGIISILENSIEPFGISLLSGLSILIPGLLLYKAGKWGAADAWIPASILFILPSYNGSILIVPYLINFLFVSSGFMIVYSLILGLMNRKVFSLLLKDLTTYKTAPILIILYSVMVLLFTFVSKLELVSGVYTIAAVSMLIIFWRYALLLEKHVFRKTIDVKDLKEGDVTEDMIWIGLTKKEVAKLKKGKKTVVIKEGVRFVPVYPLTLIVTVLYGNLLFYLLL